MATYARVLVSIGGGPALPGEQEGVAGGSPVQLTLESFDGVQLVLWEIPWGPPGWSAPDTWTRSGTRSWSVTTVGNALPPLLDLPGSPAWGKVQFRATVNRGLRNGQFSRELIDDTAAVSVFGPYGMVDVAPFEGTQFGKEGGWAAELQRALRVIGDHLGDGAGGTAGAPLSTSVPPAIAASGAAGTAAAAARADHTHAGLVSLSPGPGVTIDVTAGVATVGLSAPPSGGGAALSDNTPAAISSAGHGGTDTAASRADHTHAGVASLNGLTGDFTFQGQNGATVSFAGNVISFGPPAPTTGTGVVHYVSDQRSNVASLVVDADLAPGIAPSKIASGGVQAAGYVLTTDANGVTSWLPPTDANPTPIPGPGTTAPANVAPAAAVGTGTSFARADHAHEGVHKVNNLTGDIFLQPGTNVSFESPAANTLRINATATAANVPLAGTALPTPVAVTPTVGTASAYSREDHAHPGVFSVNGQLGAIQLTAGSGIGIALVNGAIQFSATAGPAPAPSPVAPPPVAAASSAGTSSTLAAGDHTHAGVASVNGQLGAVQLAAAQGGGIGIALVNGVVTFSSTLPAPPAPSTATPAAVAQTGATGASAAYSREDHAHAGVASVNGLQGAVLLQATGTGITLTTDPTGKTVTFASTAATVPAAGVVHSDGHALSGGPVTNADIAGGANIDITKLAPAPWNGQSLVRANDATQWATATLLSRIVINIVPGSNNDAYLFAAPSGQKCIITSALAVLTGAISGTSSPTVTLSIGTYTTPGGVATIASDYLQPVTLTPSDGVRARTIGLDLGTEVGSAFDVNKGYLADIAQGTQIWVRAAASAGVAAGAQLVVVALGYSLS